MAEIGEPGRKFLRPVGIWILPLGTLEGLIKLFWNSVSPGFERHSKVS